MPRGQLFEHVAADLARQRLAERDLPPGPVRRLLRQHDRAVAPLAKGQLERVGEPAALIGARDQPVDDEVDGDLAHAGAGRDELRFIEVLHLAVEADALESALPQPRQFVPQHARPGAQRRREQHDPLPGAFGQHPLHVVVERALHDPAAVPRAPLLAAERPQELRVIRDFGGRGDGAARSARAGALFDREHRRQPVDEVDVRPLQLLQHLARLRGQALHVLAVPFRIDRIERERRLARSARARDHHHFSTRNPELEVLEVVLARPLDVYVRRRLHAGNAHLTANGAASKDEVQIPASLWQDPAAVGS